MRPSREKWSESMKPNELAARLDGRTYGSEITDEEEVMAKGAGLVVVFGYSDDNVELRGAIHDEVGAYEGTTMRFCRKGLVPSFDSLDHDDEETMAEYFANRALPYIEVKAEWDNDGYSWTYATTVPHASFDVYDEGEKFCRGIVFAHPS